MRKFLERTFTDPIRGIGRIARGNVRQGLRDMSGAAPIAAMFAGGPVGSTIVGALGGALGAKKDASMKDFLTGGLKGAGAGLAAGAAGGALRGAQGGAQGLSGMGNAVRGAAGKVGSYVGRPEVLAGAARGAAEMYSGAQSNQLRGRELQLAEDRFANERQRQDTEASRQRRIAELLAPLFAQLSQAQNSSPRM
jgi:hypothetical protein